MRYEEIYSQNGGNGREREMNIETVRDGVRKTEREREEIER